MVNLMFCFFVKGYINLYELSNAKAIFVEI